MTNKFYMMPTLLTLTLTLAACAGAKFNAPADSQSSDLTSLSTSDSGVTTVSSSPADPSDPSKATPVPSPLPIVSSPGSSSASMPCPTPAPVVNQPVVSTVSSSSSSGGSSSSVGVSIPWNHCSGQTPEVFARMTTTEGQPMSGVTVQLQYDVIGATPILQLVVTASDGSFCFENLRDGQGYNAFARLAGGRFYPITLLAHLPSNPHFFGYDVYVGGTGGGGYPVPAGNYTPIPQGILQ